MKTEKIVFLPEHELKLKQLGIRDKFMKNFEKQTTLTQHSFLENQPEEWWDFVMNAFLWRNSPEGEGVGYWGEIAFYFGAPPFEELVRRYSN